jgi:cellulose synthase/poly-beta-1,6-N-acetylglucosamine synthase-like glycosyltransferase
MHFFLFLQITKKYTNFSSLLFYSAAPTCFDTSVSSSGSSSLPAELHANRMQWLIIFCVIRGCVSVVWRPGMRRAVWLRYQVQTDRYTPGLHITDT